MKIQELLNAIDEFAPFACAEKWDNSGLLIGNPNSEAGKVAVALDVTDEISDSVIANGCSTLITHHPLIFPVLSKINTSHFLGAMIEKLIKNGISLIAAHTNWDRCGLNTALAETLCLSDIKPLQKEDGFGTVGSLPQPLSSVEFVKFLKSKWNLSHVLYHGDEKMISKVAVCGGAGSEIWVDAADAGADVYITAEMKNHCGIAAVFEGLAIAEVGHYEMERVSLPSLCKKLKDKTGTDFIIIDIPAKTSIM